MKQFFLLLKFEVTRFAWLAPIGFYAVYSLIDGAYSHYSDGTANAPSAIQGQSLVMVIGISFFAIFYGGFGSNGGRTQMKDLGAFNLEFYFSRSIDRTSWFVIKTGMFSVLAMLPSLVFGISAYLQPMAKIELSHFSERSATRQFYLSHLKDAYVQDAGQNEESVILPQGRKSEALYMAAVNLGALILFEMAFFLSWPRMRMELLFVGFVIVDCIFRWCHGADFLPLRGGTCLCEQSRPSHSGPFDRLLFRFPILLRTKIHPRRNNLMSPFRSVSGDGAVPFAPAFENLVPRRLPGSAIHFHQRSFHLDSPDGIKRH